MGLGHLLLTVLAGLVLGWLLLVVVLVVNRPRGGPLRESVRLLPDLLRLLSRLARDADLPRGVRLRLALLMGYLALPVDLVPDVVPVPVMPTTRSSRCGCCAPSYDGSASTRCGGTGPGRPTASSP